MIERIPVTEPDEVFQLDEAEMVEGYNLDFPHFRGMGRAWRAFGRMVLSYDIIRPERHTPCVSPSPF